MDTSPLQLLEEIDFLLLNIKKNSKENEIELVKYAIYHKLGPVITIKEAAHKEALATAEMYKGNTEKLQYELKVLKEDTYKEQRVPSDECIKCKRKREEITSCVFKEEILKKNL